MEFCLQPLKAIGTYARKALTYFLRRGTVEDSLKNPIRRKCNLRMPTNKLALMGLGPGGKWKREAYAANLIPKAKRSSNSRRLLTIQTI